MSDVGKLRCRDYYWCGHYGIERPSAYDTPDKRDTIVMCEECYTAYLQYFSNMRRVCSGRDFPGWHERTLRE
jgi:hypothetical protein